MDGTQGAAFQIATPESFGLSRDAWPSDTFQSTLLLKAPVQGLNVRRADDMEAIVVTKTVPGFDAATVDAMRTLVADLAANRHSPLKFLIFDFAHGGFPLSLGAEGFEALLTEVSDLILTAPVVSISCARANLAGADMEFALACSMLVGEADARFSFAADPTVSIGTYGLLAQKIGFVRAERLMEKGDIIGAAEMHELYLLKEVMEAGAGEAGIEAYVHKTARRHNACYGIYRAQRMATRTVV